MLLVRTQQRVNCRFRRKERFRSAHPPQASNARCIEVKNRPFLLERCSIGVQVQPPNAPPSAPRRCSSLAAVDIRSLLHASFETRFRVARLDPSRIATKLQRAADRECRRICSAGVVRLRICPVASFRKLDCRLIGRCKEASRRKHRVPAPRYLNGNPRASGQTSHRASRKARAPIPSIRESALPYRCDR